MMRNILQQAAGNAMALGPAVLVQGMQLKRPIDVVREPSLSVDDKRTILAAWASDYYAVESKPALRQVPGTLEPVSIDEVQSALKELDRRYGI
ncbi:MULTISPECIES: hypothetical protein [Rhizobium]|uniref:hypothetical protein n=1 Tax=Rhizobium TaxID=379 RepID=UPI000BE9ABAD|nr:MULTISPECIES: hypothetical protein [Rhizobium]MBY4593239.1 hypothetical protein [Rhizobium redzepovicii]MBY4617962.1 hypothetical protein [Rhizobium redzepovicii]MDF0663687.1 hypothetical protein [Rhizobium sp. BC49]PDS80405.1 hypothetical protein CO654_30840 [Rhizobium sp. L18]TBY42992.1 hypothetical protein E0H54_29270 [Rhizobium leguminosarum bv. viciae]